MNFFRLVKQDLRNIVHNPALIISNTALPLILIGVMGFVTRGNFGTAVSSYDYYGINMLILSVALVAITASNAFMEEKIMRGNIRTAYTPVSKTQIYLSKVVSTYIFASICYGLLIPFCQGVLGLNLGGSRMIWFELLLNVFIFFGCCLGVMFCCIFRNEEQANSIMQIPIFLFVFLGGVIFRVNGLGKAIPAISNISPVKWIAQCSYQIIYDADLHLLLPVALGLVALSVVCLLISNLLFKPEEYV